MGKNGERVLPLNSSTEDRPRDITFKQPTASYWSRLKRKLLHASTGTPSDGQENRSETSGTSAGSRDLPAYVLDAKKDAREKQLRDARLRELGETDGEAETEDEEDWAVDTVVVDQYHFYDDDGEHAHFANAKHGEGGIDRHSATGATTTAHSETAGSVVKIAGWDAVEGVVTFFRGLLIPALVYFFEPRFGDREKELNFQKERWYNSKRLAWFASCFFLLNMAMYIGLVNVYTTYEKVVVYGILPLLTAPIMLFVAMDWARKRPYFYGFWIAAAAFVLPYLHIATMADCNFFEGGSCNGNAFLLTSFYASVLPTVSLFGLGVRRFPLAVFQVGYFVLQCSLALPVKTSFVRNAINFIIYAAFLQFLHYTIEKTDRRMYTLRVQLKISYRAQQKAQIAEKKAANSKRRFVSYIFHEVRVPLNTAYLAFQNLQQSGGWLQRKDEDEMVEVYALESSLQQVQRILNDVLDLQRMDAGRFESSNQPFNFHKSINALVASLKVACHAKDLGLDVSLDERIDSLPQSVDWQGSPTTFVIGDEIRLRQVLTNLSSNAVKFTSSGAIKVRTLLIHPPAHPNRDPASPTTPSGAGWHADEIVPVPSLDKDTTPLSEKTYVNRNSDEVDLEKGQVKQEPQLSEKTEVAEGVIQKDHAKPSLGPRHDSDESDQSGRGRDYVIVRIEIEDNGPGIQPSDMSDLRLFSPYVQTEIGRVQGGKGSGLGLSIVKAIVERSNGRLGVKSNKNGSCFWLEFRYPLALAHELHALEPPTPTPLSGPSSLPPARPPVRPLPDSELLGSQLSAYSDNARYEALSVNIPPSPNHMERAISPSASEGRRFSSGRSPSSASTSLIRACSVHPSSPCTCATSAMDKASPFTSENWKAPMSQMDRAIVPVGSVFTAPAMQLTIATPPDGVTPISGAGLQSTTSLGTTVASYRTPSPSPTLSAVNQAQSPGTKSPPPRKGVKAAAPAQREDPNTSKASTAQVPVELPPTRDPAPFTPHTIATANEPTPPLSAPMTALPESAVAAPQATSVPDPERHLEALVVDDDALTRKLMSRMMTRLGCIVSDAENGALALEILLGKGDKPPRFFDIVTLDNAMPVMTGEEAIRALRKAGRTDLVVGATGNALQADQQSYKNAGVDAVLCKPISLKDLKAMLATARQRRTDKDNAEAAAEGVP